MKKAFTLIELLVVVLIIGILAAIALPQYTKAVEKSKSAQAVTMLKTIYQGAEEYYLANNTWPSSFSELTVTPPWTGNVKWYTGNEIKDVVSNGEWSLVMTKNDDFYGIGIGRISGKHTGGGFYIWHEYNVSSAMPGGVMVCAEKKAAITKGDFCKKVMQSGDYLYSGAVLHYFKM